MSTIKVSAKDVRVGDDLWLGGVPHRITRIEPYQHPSFPGKMWAQACSDGPEGIGKAAWGITLELTNPSAYYEISVRPEVPGS